MWNRHHPVDLEPGMMTRPRVLVVDDDDNIRSLLFSILDRAGYRVNAVGSVAEALEAFRRDQSGVIISDLRMPGVDGHDFISTVLEENPEAVVVVLTGYGTVDEAVALMRKGVYHIITKPAGMDEILLIVERATRDQALKARSRELEKRLEITERLAMIGKLAAGVAHELNNPLDGVSRFVKLNLETMPLGSEAREFQEEALRGLKRMSSIVKDLLTFSRNIALEVEEESIETMLRDAVSQALGSRPESEIEVRFELAVPEVSVPRGIYQVFQNIVKNAVDAVPATGGVIVLCAGIKEGETCITITDNGCGIPAAVKDRIFEPFFTTKAVGSGTGLGLSIVSRILERFGGGLSIESEEGAGTQVTVYLPTPSSSPRERTDAEGPVERENVHSPR
jgi:signal transduction histidine kinase